MKVATATITELPVMAGRWISERAFANLHGLSKQTLANWRYRDHKAGRAEAGPGYPQYRYFGRAVRYWLVGGPAI